eukprot:TRINITY_DN240_c0_g1_i1.p2 TRINITY_DN240_c0_g1~~TRINITY_DN240_c0_g1_i1.p2  ORF type:complete len:388 (-),score=239.38 TRINITY_DN240_c0_g1_i1:45-1208(-)
MSRAASVAQQAIDKGAEAKSLFTVTPGSEQVRATIERDGQMSTLQAIGGQVLANACGPCIGQWERHDVEKGTANSIITSYNRNFTGRADGNPATHSFVASPDIVTAMVLGGRLSFNPLTDTLDGKDGPFVLAPPSGDELPPRGFDAGEDTFQRPPEDGAGEQIVIADDSARLQLLAPFAPRTEREQRGLRVLIKTKGKCTTDHISMAGPWLKYRGHLDNISNNMLIGAVNAENDAMNSVEHRPSGEFAAVPDVARRYKADGVGWVVVGGDNYGEGSSREHAALEPRHLGAAAVITKSFARIHETNLKKMAVLPLTFADAADYDRISGRADVSLLALDELAPGRNVRAEVANPGETPFTIELKHTLNEQQIKWYWAGSCLNHIKSVMN